LKLSPAASEGKISLISGKFNEFRSLEFVNLKQKTVVRAALMEECLHSQVRTQNFSFEGAGGC
jgi:hypothetical protein